MLFEEHITWNRMYGVTMRRVPKSGEDFQQYWDRLCRQLFEDIWAARKFLDL